MCRVERRVYAGNIGPVSTLIVSDFIRKTLTLRAFRYGVCLIGDPFLALPYQGTNISNG